MAPKVSVYIATSVDGFIARLDGGLDWLEHDTEGDDYGFHDFMASVDTLVMGRITFQQVLAFGKWPYGEKRMAVLSRTLDAGAVPPELRDRVEVSALAPDALVADLGRRGANHIYVDGGKTIQAFLAANLVDEIILSKIPVLLGEGIPLFGPQSRDIHLEHLATTAFPSGLVQTKYRVRGKTE